MRKKVAYTALSLFLLILVYGSLSISPIFFKKFPETPNASTKIIAHRGASNIAPENTLASIREALKSNPDRIEIDVQQTADGIIVLLHDISLERTTNGKGLVKNKTYVELEKLDAGSWFSNKFKEEKIPTLEEAIRLVNGKCKLIIEIKKGHSFYPNIEKNILQIIKKLHAENWVAIHAFDDSVIDTVHALDPSISLHKLLVVKFQFSPIIISNAIDNIELDNYTYVKEYSIHYAFANKKIINLLKAKGKKVNVWTVNDPATAKQLIALGVDGIITNNPRLLKD